MDETKNVKVKGNYPELRDALGKALLCQRELELELEDLIALKRTRFRAAFWAKWFSEDRYRKWAKYWAVRADIVSCRTDIKENLIIIKDLEDKVKGCYVKPKPATTGKPDGKEKPKPSVSEKPGGTEKPAAADPAGHAPDHAKPAK